MTQCGDGGEGHLVHEFVGGVAVFAVGAVSEDGVGFELFDGGGDLAGEHHRIMFGGEEGVVRADGWVGVAEKGEAFAAELADGAHHFLFARAAEMFTVGDRRLAQFAALAAREADDVHRRAVRG